MSKHQGLAKSVQNMMVLAQQHFSSSLSYSEIPLIGFYPKELYEDDCKIVDDLKTSQEETGLGHGKEIKDVFDQIDNLDLLD